MNVHRFAQQLWNLLRCLDRKKLMAAGLQILAVILLMVICCRAGAAKATKAYEAQLDAEAAQAAAEAAEAAQEGAEADPQKIEAEYIARVIYGTALNNTEDAQRLVVWCVLNRVDNDSYPDTVKEVCQQADQWMGYSDGNPVIQGLYDLAYEELTQWHSGGYRPMADSYVFMSWSKTEIVLRDTFEETAATHYWRAG